MLLGNYNYFQERSFLKGNEENPALVLSNVHNRTSARDGPMFGSKGPSMNTSSLTTTVNDYLTVRKPKGFSLYSFNISKYMTMHVQGNIPDVQV
jgi:hypothetical protein